MAVRYGVCLPGGGAGLMPGPETGSGGPVTATLLVDAWLRERAPAAEVAGMLRCAWRGDLGAIRTPLPDECFDLFWVDDGSLWLSGPESASWAPRGHPPARNAVGVRCLPGAGPSLFGIAASEVRDLRVRLDDLWPCSIVREVSDRMASQASDHARMRELERAVGRLAAGAAPVDRLALALAAEVGIARPGPARAIARSAGLSERQIHRRCTEAFGYGPAVLARILRLQRALHLARSGRGHRAWRTWPSRPATPTSSIWPTTSGRSPGRRRARCWRCPIRTRQLTPRPETMTT